MTVAGPALAATLVGLSFRALLATSGHRPGGGLAMWVWLDRVSLILFDAALSTGLFLSAVVFAILVCRQPSRRLLIVRSSLLASLAIFPLVALLPLPRVDVLDLVLQADLLPPASALDPGTGDPLAARPFKPESGHGSRSLPGSKETMPPGLAAGCRAA